MRGEEFFRSPLALGIALALGTTGGAMMPRAAFAQPTDSNGQAIEEVVVTGIRSSLKQSMDIKRDNAGVVDAITAEDIGAFPDTNLAESLQRITGVSIDRSRGEGKYVTVRGFGPEFNLVLLNGRQMPTTGGGGNASDAGVGRSFDFGNLASESVSAVEVFKSGKADLPTGGIGSTINIRTTRPLQSPGLHATVQASGMHDTSTEEGDEWTPEVSALVSNTFLDDTVGISLTAIRQERNNGANTGSVGGWRSFTGNTDNCWCSANPSEWGGIPYNDQQVNRPTSPDERYSVPQNTGYELAEWDRTRTNGQLTMQWKPVESVTATVDYTYSEVELERTFSNYSAWYNFGGQETVWDGASNASPLVYSENNDGRGDFAMGAGADATKSENESTGFNLVWQVTDRLRMEFDAHDSTAELQPDSEFGSAALLSIASFSRQKTTTYFDRGDLPVLALDLARPLSADDMIVTGSVFANNYAKMDIEQQRLAGVFEFEEDRFLQSIDFGVELTEVSNQSAFANVQRDAWGGVTQPGAISDLMTAASADGSFSEISGGDDSDLTTEYFTYSMPALIARTEQLMASGDATTFVTSDMGDCGTGLCASSNYSTDRRTQEDSTAAYLQLNMATEVVEMPLGIRLGVRYEQTDVDSRALAPNYTGVNWVGGNEFSAVRGSGDFTQLEGDYDVLLPNLDLKLNITEDLVGRMAFSKTITRPNYADIQGGQTIDQLLRIDGGNGSRGNPDLEPLESDNIDIGFEYYYGDDSYVSAGYFTKQVENFIGRTEFNEALFAMPHPGQGALAREAAAAIGGTPTSGELYQWILANRPTAPGVDAANGIISGVAGDPLANFKVIVPVNLDEATVDGWEFNIQHNFGESGFGLIANATIVDSDTDYDDMDLSPQFVVSGVSDSANLVGYYEKYGFSVRVAWNWRDDFLAGTGQANVGGIPPTYVEAYDQIDISASYKWGDHLQFFVDAINVTDETTHVYGRTTQQTLFAAQSGPRYNLGMRYTL